jgi:mono/diheme cytochrome c family protein
LAAASPRHAAAEGAAPRGGDIPGASAVRGQIVYQKACAACHGERGDGQAPAARYLEPRPRDFTSGTFKFRSTPNGELPTDQDLLRVVELGIPGTQMPAWRGVLTAQERADVVAYVKTFSADFQDGAPEPLVFPEPPEATPAALVEGRMVYMLMECWACHGGKGRGDGKSGRTLEDDWGRRIRPWNLTAWRYKAGNDPKSLYRTFTTGLNGTPMPAYALDGFLVPGDAQVDPAKYSEAYKPGDIEQLREWLAGQPGEAALKGMTEAQRQELGERRKWALVHYIRSLVRKPGFFGLLFAQDTEVTR